MGLKQAFFLLFCTGWTLFFISCGNDVVHETQTLVYQEDEDEKMDFNKELIRKENAKIALVAQRYQWDLTQTPTGLFYEILTTKEGNLPQPRDIVTIKGKIYIENGTLIYNDQADGLKEFMVNRSDDPVGLHELVKLMHEGEKARAIIPSYLAYGITGDGEQVPFAAFLLCEIELVKIN